MDSQDGGDVSLKDCWCSSRFVTDSLCFTLVAVVVALSYRRLRELDFDVDNCKMATGEIPAPGVFHGDKSKDEKTFRQWKKKCERWFIAKEISSEKKKVQWIGCLLEDKAITPMMYTK